MTKEKFNPIQFSVFPSILLCTESNLYFRSNEKADISFSKQLIKLQVNGIISTNTYFNSFSVRKWKKYTNINSLSFFINFTGRIKISWYSEALEFKGKVLQEDYLESSTNNNTEEISLPFWDDIHLGMLYFTIEALDNSEINYFYYATLDEPKRKIKLGIVITHFNRKNYVKNAIQRFNEFFIEKPYIKEKFDIIVVDNSSNIGELDNVKVIPNRNLGGAGGFTRGLLHLMDNDYTHCLFMDDDASCEMESIFRTITFIENSQIEDISISGAMLREVKPYEQYENGARYNGICTRIKKELNLLKVRNILFNEKEENIDYAAWWFFIFPIHQVKSLAFPYFVRGDDISFSLANKFNIITLNGICSWQPDFSTKNSPVNFYLDVRSNVMPLLNGLVPSSSLKNVILVLLALFFRNNLTYHYETARAIILALNDIQKGPKYWLENVDMVVKRKEILSFVEEEQYKDIPKEILSQAKLSRANTSKENKRLPIFKRIYYVLCLNGHIFPKIFFKKGISMQYLFRGVGFFETYRYRKAICIDEITNKGQILTHSKKKFFKYSFLYLIAIIQFLKNYKKLKNIYTNEFDYFTSREFWEKEFNKE